MNKSPRSTRFNRQQKAGSAQELRTLARQEEVLRLRAAGFSYVEIGKKLGFSQVAAWKIALGAIEKLRAEVGETAKEVRDFELMRLDGILSKLWPDRGEPRVADTILRTMERRARLLGLDEPERFEVKTEEMTDEQKALRIQELLALSRRRQEGGGREPSQEAQAVDRGFDPSGDGGARPAAAPIQRKNRPR